MSFTFRQKQILQLVTQGHCNKTIAKHLGISPHTVRDHISAMLAQTECRNRLQLALLHTKNSKPPPPALLMTRRRVLCDRQQASKLTPYI